MVELREVGPGRTECCHEPIPAAADNHLDKGSLSIDRCGGAWAPNGLVACFGVL